jgi:hypothetical protein
MVLTVEIEISTLSVFLICFLIPLILIKVLVLTIFKIKLIIPLIILVF